jgi:hypothetical protein
VKVLIFESMFFLTMDDNINAMNKPGKKDKWYAVFSCGCIFAEEGALLYP